jgi:hypothetical protein
MTVLSAEHRALMSELEQLISEERNPNTMEIDLLPIAEVLRVINREDRSVADAVGEVIAEIACAVDCIVDAFVKGGRLIYMGAGTSGRLGVLDAAECPSTFSVPADMVVGLIAGGADAFSKATEGAEDDAAAGVSALKDIALTRKDCCRHYGQRSYAVCGRGPDLCQNCGRDDGRSELQSRRRYRAHGRHLDPAGRRAGGSDRVDPPKIWHSAEACAQHAEYCKHDPLRQVLPEPYGRSQTDQYKARRPGGAYHDAGDGLHDRAGSRGA